MTHTDPTTEEDVGRKVEESDANLLSNDEPTSPTSGSSSSSCHLATQP